MSINMYIFFITALAGHQDEFMFDLMRGCGGMILFFRKYDKVLGLVFGLLTISFFMLSGFNSDFLNWAFDRHHNQLSWYIRPLFLIPFCYFAFNKSWTGMCATIFLLLTSMFWFPKPLETNHIVGEFLDMEKEWLSGDWDLAKISMSLL